MKAPFIERIFAHRVGRWLLGIVVIPIATAFMGFIVAWALFWIVEILSTLLEITGNLSLGLAHLIGLLKSWDVLFVVGMVVAVVFMAYVMLSEMTKARRQRQTKDSEN